MKNSSLNESKSAKVLSLADIEVVKEMDEVLSISELSAVVGGKVNLRADSAECSCTTANCNSNCQYNTGKN